VAWDELGRSAADANQRDRDKWIAAYIGLLAVVLAVCSMGGDNASKEATLRNIEASNTWAFFQAKNMRRHVLRVENDAWAIKLATDKSLIDADKALITAKVDEYKKQIDILTKDDKGEGLDQLWQKGKDLEAARDVAMKQDPYFDYAAALLQIAIVLASVSIISGGTLLLAISGALGAAGMFLTFNGFTLAYTLSFIG